MSLGAHMTVLGGLGFVQTPPELLGPGTAEFEVLEPEPEPLPEEEEPEPDPEPEPEPEPEPKPRPQPKAEPDPEPPPPAPQDAPPPTDDAPVDFTGVTLAAEGNSSWSSVVGNGQAITRPQGRIGAKTGPVGVPGGTPGGTGPALISTKNLARKPQPPSKDMNSLLVKFYPAKARAQGIEGVGVLRVRVMPDGRIRILSVRKESGSHGFADACKAVLEAGGRWTPASDHAGKIGAFDIDYTCRFEVNF